MNWKRAILLLLVVLVAVPVAAQEADAPAQILESDVTYTVVERDNLDRIGAFFDVRVACIRETNNLPVGAILQPGDQLVISATCPAYDGAAPVINPRPNAPGRTGADDTYVVRPQDTLDEIGQVFNISVQALKQVNGIPDGRRLEAGTVIMLPVNAPEYGMFPAMTLANAPEMANVPGQTYVTTANDTLMDIAQRFNISIVTLRVVNNLGYAPNVAPGTSLFIPEGATPYNGFPNPAELHQLESRAEGAEFSGEVVVVQPQETVDGIGARLNKDHYCILAANNITNTRMVIPGTALVIPAECGPYTGFDVVGR